MVLEESVTAEARSWNDLSRPIGGVGRLGQKHGTWNGLSRRMGVVWKLEQKSDLGRVYHGLRTM